MLALHWIESPCCLGWMQWVGGAFSLRDAHSLPRPTVLDLSLGPSTQDARAQLPHTGSALKQLKLNFRSHLATQL